MGGFLVWFTFSSSSFFLSLIYVWKEGWIMLILNSWIEVKELKSRVRNVIDPTRNLGHTDRALKKGAETAEAAIATASTPAASGKGAECEDCK